MKTLIFAASLLLGARKQKTLPVSWIVIWALTVLTPYAAQEGDFTYWDSGAGITITGYTGSGGAVAIPDAILGKPVTSIGETAFSGTGVTSITIGNSVITVDTHAFDSCIGLTSVTIGNNVTSVGDGAFRSCFGLTSLTIGNSVTNIGQSAFYGCSGLNSVTLPESVTSLGYYAFFGCNALTSVTIGNSVARIGSGVFAYCQSLTSVMIGRAVTAIAIRSDPHGPMLDVQDGAFQGCTRLRTLYFLGNAPGDNSLRQLEDADHATVFYRAGATGWGSTFGGRPTVLWIPTDDLDGDGMSNEQEIATRTDPKDAASLLAFERAPRPEALVEMDQTAIPAGQHALYFQSIPGNRYEILASERLGGTWASLATVDAAALQKRVLVDKPANAAFYRIQVAR